MCLLYTTLQSCSTLLLLLFLSSIFQTSSSKQHGLWPWIIKVVVQHSEHDKSLPAISEVTNSWDMLRHEKNDPTPVPYSALPVPVAWSTNSRFVGLSGCSRNAPDSFTGIPPRKLLLECKKKNESCCALRKSWCSRIPSPAKGLSELPKAALASAW